MPQGNLYIVTAPSGAGKTTLVSALLKSEKSLRVSVSHTTRPARPGEVDGVNYHFVDKEDFMDRLVKGDFLESAEVYGNHYGTSHSWVKDQLATGIDVILEIDWQGAAQVRNLFPDCCYIFILPPSLDSLRERLTDRGQDDADTIEKRMRQAVSVITHVAEANYVVVNEEFDAALDDLRCIVRSWKLTVMAQQMNRGDLLASLGKG